MRARIKATIFRLKASAKKRTLERRRLKRSFRAQADRIVKLQTENEALRTRLAPQPIFNYVYPAQTILLAVFMVVHAGASLRCAATTAEFFARLMGWPVKKPSPTSIRDWVLKCGHYALEYTPDLHGDYAAIIDESIQIGGEKLLLLLGIKNPTQRAGNAQPLTTKDVQILGMEVQSSWTGDLVADFIRRRLNAHPHLKLLYVVCDQGTILLAALRKLDLTWVSDCSHVMMNAAKELFDHDPTLSKFCGQVGTLRRQLTLSKWSFLMPPTLRNKDRFLRVFVLCDWVDRMNDYWAKLPAEGRAKVSFYRTYRTLIKRLEQVRALIAITAGVLKTNGLSRSSEQAWQLLVDDYLATQQVVSRKARRFVQLMEKYFADHATLTTSEQPLLCCSDIIESIFGRYKNKGGMQVISADVLSIALYNCELTTAYVTEAMLTTRLETVADWSANNVCHNRYSLMHKMRRELKNEHSKGISD